MSKETLIVFFKSPEPGKTKTRLMPELTAKQACEVYRDLFSMTLKAARQWQKASPKRHIAFWGTGDRALWSSLQVHEAKVQFGMDLGMRMENAIREELRKSKRVCIIGSDAPQMRAELLERAFESLSTFDAVLGPSEDGGYYLLGMTHVPAMSFTELPWSKDDTLARTRQRLEGFHMSMTTLETLRDVDTYDDLEFFGLAPTSSSSG